MCDRPQISATTYECAFRQGEQSVRRFILAGRLNAMPSMVIRRFHYAPEKRELTIEFVSGRLYRYSDVPSHEAEGMLNVRSKGSYFNRRIRDHYPCRELVRSSDQ